MLVKERLEDDWEKHVGRVDEEFLEQYFEMTKAPVIVPIGRQVIEENALSRVID